MQWFCLFLFPFLRLIPFCIDFQFKFTNLPLKLYVYPWSVCCAVLVVPSFITCSYSGRLTILYRSLVFVGPFLAEAGTALLKVSEVDHCPSFSKIIEPLLSFIFMCTRFSLGKLHVKTNHLNLFCVHGGNWREGIMAVGSSSPQLQVLFISSQWLWPNSCIMWYKSKFFISEVRSYWLYFRQ